MFFVHSLFFRALRVPVVAELEIQNHLTPLLVIFLFQLGRSEGSPGVSILAMRRFAG